MGIASQQFEGISTRVPDVYTKSEFPPGKGAGGTSLNIVAIIGQGKGGIPYNASGVADENRFSVLSSVGQAIDLIRGGDGLHMTEFFLSPSKDPTLSSPQVAVFFRVDPAIQGSATLDASATPTIDLKSTRYGALANQIARKIEDGTILGHKVTIKFQGETLVEKDDVGFEYFEILYTGGDTTCTMTISATQFEVSTTSTPEDDFTLLFTEYTKLGDLVTYINEHPSYTCTLLDKSNADTTTFDIVATQDVKTDAYTAVAHIEALIQFITNNSQGELVATLTSAATRVDIDNDSNFVFLSSGSEGSITNTNWAGALALMEKFSINHVLAATGDQSILTMIDQHCHDMSKIVAKRNRSWGAGALSGLSQIARKLESKALNSARGEYWLTEFTRPDVTANNVATLFAPFFAAAMGAGIRFGNHETISATFKTVNAIAVSETLNNDEADSFINAGGSYLKREERGIVVGHNVTTFQGENLILNLPSMLRTADAITLDSQAKIKLAIADLKRAPNASVINSIKNYLLTIILPGYRDTKGWLTNDPISGDPAYSDIEFDLLGDRFDFSFTGIIPAPMHFVFIKQKFVITGS